MTRDSAIWTATLLTSVIVFLGGHFDLLRSAFPAIAPVWESRIELFSALAGFISGYLKMSPLALSQTNLMAIRPEQTINPLQQGEPPDEHLGVDLRTFQDFD